MRSLSSLMVVFASFGVRVVGGPPEPPRAADGEAKPGRPAAIPVRPCGPDWQICRYFHPLDRLEHRGQIRLVAKRTTWLESERRTLQHCRLENGGGAFLLEDDSGREVCVQYVTSFPYSTWAMEFVRKVDERGKPRRHEVRFGGVRYFDRDGDGAIDAWYFEYLAGIKPNDQHPGFAHVLLAPHTPSGLDRVEAHVTTVRGPVGSQWERRGNDIRFSFQVPPSAKATIRIPAEAGTTALFNNRPILSVPELHAKALPEGGSVMIFVGRLGQLNAEQRRQGVIDELLDRTKDPTRRDPPGDVIKGEKYTIVGTQTDGFDKAKAKQNAQDAISRYPDLGCMVGLFAYNPPLCLQAIREAGRVVKPTAK